jgi:hypothetical protein
MYVIFIIHVDNTIDNCGDDDDDDDDDGNQACLLLVLQEDIHLFDYY